MDDRQFDTLTKSIANRLDRRRLIKGLLGFAGASSIGLTRTGLNAEAARRPVATATPPSCPGSQIWNGSECVCATGTVCGPACCIAPAQCCDGACCLGICYLEEFCCPDGHTLCADGACLPPDSCCSNSECPPVNCQQVACNDGRCEQTEFDCRLGTNCCATGDVCMSDHGTCCVPNTATLCQTHCGLTTNNCGQLVECEGGCSS
jgi:hypothetical protein